MLSDKIDKKTIPTLRCLDHYNLIHAFQHIDPRFVVDVQGPSPIFTIDLQLTKHNTNIPLLCLPYN